MSYTTLSQFLQSIGLDEFIASFEAQHVDLDIIRDLTDADLKELGIPLGARKRIQRALGGGDTISNPQEQAMIEPPPPDFLHNAPEPAAGDELLTAPTFVPTEPLAPDVRWDASESAGTDEFLAAPTFVPEDGPEPPDSSASSAAAEFDDPPALTSNAISPPAGPSTTKVDFIGSMILGRYRIESLVGRGGMGEVYRAIDTNSETAVAIKRIIDGVSEQHKARFSREIAVLKRLNHPLLLGVIDSGTNEGDEYLVTPFLDGIDLGQYIQKKGPCPVGTALKIIHMICGGLNKAHAQGIVHRDIKPSNIFMQKSQKGTSRPVVVDFGLAKDSGTEGAMDPSLSLDNQMMGTPEYMAPEQWSDAKNASFQADIFGLGATLYHMITGDSPRVLTQGKIPGAAWEIICTCTKQNPAERYADCKSLAQAIEDLHTKHKNTQKDSNDWENALQGALQDGRIPDEAYDALAQQRAGSSLTNAQLQEIERRVLSGSTFVELRDPRLWRGQQKYHIAHGLNIFGMFFGFLPFIGGIMGLIALVCWLMVSKEPEKLAKSMGIKMSGKANSVAAIALGVGFGIFLVAALVMLIGGIILGLIPLGISIFLLVLRLKLQRISWAKELQQRGIKWPSSWKTVIYPWYFFQRNRVLGHPPWVGAVGSVLWSFGLVYLLIFGLIAPAANGSGGGGGNVSWGSPSTISHADVAAEARQVLNNTLQRQGHGYGACRSVTVHRKLNTDTWSATAYFNDGSTAPISVRISGGMVYVNAR